MVWGIISRSDDRFALVTGHFKRFYPAGLVIHADFISSDRKSIIYEDFAGKFSLFLRKNLCNMLSPGKKN
jgi:hypothetical protein